MNNSCCRRLKAWLSRVTFPAGCPSCCGQSGYLCAAFKYTERDTSTLLM